MSETEHDQRQSLLTFIYEGTQDAHNYRPDMSLFEGLTLSALKAHADKISDAVFDAIQREKAEKVDAAERFEAHIGKMMADHNIDRETAIRWDMDALGITEDDIQFYGMDYYCFRHGLEYGYFPKPGPGMN